jgi:hypothetical protein
MNLGEEYRWNINVIYYGFDNSFKNYFGTRGMEEVRKAIKILNDIPPMSKVSTTLSEFPTDTRRVNYRASALNIVDLKSYALAMMVEQLGLASPERFTWTLFARIDQPPPVVYNVIKRNFDPVTLQPSSYVNDTLYTYIIREFATQPPVADAVEVPVDPLAFQYTAVASVLGAQLGGALLPGDFLTGLTRDDIGGLRYMYARKGPYANRNIEPLVSDAITNAAGGGGTPWSPVAGGGSVNVALRPGVDKIEFREAKYDSELGFFIVTTNSYKDVYITNSFQRTQTIQRPLVQPDIIFGAGNLGAGLLSRSGTTNWVNNAATNAQVILAGPGIIQPPMFLTFNKTGPFYVNQDPDFLDEQTATIDVIWGSYDGTTNEPVVYPIGTSIMEIEALVLSGGQ